MVALQRQHGNPQQLELPFDYGDEAEQEWIVIRNRTRRTKHLAVAVLKQILAKKVA